MYVILSIISFAQFVISSVISVAVLSAISDAAFMLCYVMHLMLCLFRVI
jgi:hypothetical protein